MNTALNNLTNLDNTSTLIDDLDDLLGDEVDTDYNYSTVQETPEVVITEDVSTDKVAVDDAKSEPPVKPAQTKTEAPAENAQKPAADAVMLGSIANLDTNFTVKENAKMVDVSKFTDHINLLNDLQDDSFTITKNGDGRQGIWLTSANFRYKILLAKSGTCRIFMLSLPEDALSKFDESMDIVLDAGKRRVLAPAKPEKLTAEKLMVLVNWAIQLDIKKKSAK